MTIPSYQTLMPQMLRLIADGHEQIRDCTPHIARQFGLTNEELEARLPSGKQTVIANRAHWARNYLSQAGLVEMIRRGHYRISDSGREVLATDPAVIDRQFLMQFQPFREFMDRSKVSGIGEIEERADATGPTEGEETRLANEHETPETVMEAAYLESQAALASDLLDLIRSVDPTRFEQIIVDLLVAMGYGGGKSEMGRRIGQAGDGGIDGIINEDALGLDAVYIQAKRYAAHVPVDRPALQAFVGSLTGEGANKGVFVTTSRFTKGAVDYVDRVSHRIDLLDGDRLARLLIAHDVGVRARQTFIVRSIDEDYFAET